MCLTMLFSISHVESEPLSLKNLKRRSEFFEQGKKKEALMVEGHGFHINNYDSL